MAIVPVLDSLGEFPDARGRYWCLMHDDHRPGGKPSAEVARKDPRILWCWSCGGKMDAITYVQRVRHCTEAEAAAYVSTVSGTVVLTGAARSAAPPSRQLETELAAAPTKFPVIRFCSGRGWAREVADYARESWGWIGDAHGRVVMPHRNRDGLLTGLKFRVPPGWDKRARPDSQFRQLYGLWRPEIRRMFAERATWRSRPIVICEGEPDTMWAAYNLEPRGSVVLGLPTASYKFRDEEVELFRNRTVVLAFDGDAAGDGARARAEETLSGVVSGELRVAVIPRGEDVGSKR